MHDDYTDVQALPFIIDGIRARGYTVGGPLKNILIHPTASSAMGSESRSASIAYPSVGAPFAAIVMGREDRPPVN
jgi:hypothetical protein